MLSPSGAVGHDVAAPAARRAPVPRPEAPAGVVSELQATGRRAVEPVRAPGRSDGLACPPAGLAACQDDHAWLPDSPSSTTPAPSPSPTAGDRWRTRRTHSGPWPT